MHQQWQYHDAEPSSALAACKAMGAKSCIFFAWDEQDALTFIYNEFNKENLADAACELIASLDPSIENEDDDILDEDPNIDAIIAVCKNGCAGAFWYEDAMIVFSADIDEDKAEQISSTMLRIIETSEEKLH